MNKKELLDNIYKFYPRNIDSINYKTEYISSQEYKNLIRYLQTNKTKTEDYIQEIKKIEYKNISFTDITNFDWQDRCYNLEFKKQVGNDFLYLNLLKSIIVPTYCIKCNKVTYINNRYKYDDILNSNFSETNLISDILQISNEFNLFVIDEKLLKNKIPDINFQDIQMGDFTFFNALFN